MATIKSYTSIEQSKKLAEILPLESADMYFQPYPNDEDWYDIPNFGEANKKFNQLPCWSLASLLDILPLEVSIGKQTDGVDAYYYIASCDARYCDVYSHRHLNVIDACYEAILKLHELKWL